MNSVRYTASNPRIAFESKGQGAPVLFLHGIGGNRSNWSEELDLCSHEFQAIAMDFRGYGDSGDLEPGFAVSDFVQDVVSVLDELQIPQAHIVGLSMGGLVAQALYASTPDRVSSLCLVACRSGADPVFESERRGEFLQNRLGPMRAGGPEALAQSLAPRLIGRSASPEARHRVLESLRRLRPDAYQQIVQARMHITPFLDLGSVCVPVLVIGSDEDKVAPAAQMRALAGAIPNAALAMIHGAGHLINIEQPKAFAQALLPFLRSVPASQDSQAINPSETENADGTY